MVVYVEQVFFIGFFIDGILLFLAGRLWGCQLRWRRLFPLCMAGGVWSVLSLFPGWQWLSNTVALVAGIPMLGYLCYRGSGKLRTAKAIGALMGLTMLSGGAGIAAAVGSGAALRTGAGIGLMVLVLGLTIPGWRKANLHHQKDIMLSGVRLRAAIDTGNCLSEPLSGLPVVVLSCAAPMLDCEYNSSHTLRIDTATGSDMLPVSSSQKLIVFRGLKKIDVGQVCIVRMKHPLPHGLDALLPPLPDIPSGGERLWRDCA